MDTRFWGPSGWALLHLIAATPIEPARRIAVRDWFYLLEYALPCKYCRASFHDYIQLQPLTLDILKGPDTFGRWLFDIHNRVNAKLRGQGLLTTADPSWASIKAKYEAMSKDLCDRTPLLGWDFMISVAFTTPDRKPQMPMPDTPEGDTRQMTIGERNRYNLLTRAERVKKLRAWWALIPSILPCAAWRSAWPASVPPLNNRDSVLRWMWQVEEQVCAGLRCPTPHPSQAAMRQEMSAFESRCGTLKNGKTCRTQKHRQRMAAITRRLRWLQTQAA